MPNSDMPLEIEFKTKTSKKKKMKENKLTPMKLSVHIMNTACMTVTAF